MFKRFCATSLISAFLFIPSCKRHEERRSIHSTNNEEKQPISAPDYAHIGILLEKPPSYSSRENPGLSEATIKPNQLVYLSLFYNDKDGVTWSRDPELREERIYIDDRLVLNGISNVVASPGFRADNHAPIKFHTEGMTPGEYIIRYEVEDACDNVNKGLAKLIIEDS